MHWKFDIDQRSLVKAVDGSSVKSAKIAYPDRYPLKIDLFRGPTPFQLSGEFKATLKPTNQQTRSALAVMSVIVDGASTIEGVLSLSTVPVRDFVRDFGERPAALELLAIDQSGAEIASWTVGCEVARRYSEKEDVAEDLPNLKASQLEAESGTSNIKWMTPLRVWDAIRKWAETNFTWESLQGVPGSFPPESHTHSSPDDLKEALAAAGIELLED